MRLTGHKHVFFFDQEKLRIQLKIVELTENVQSLTEANESYIVLDQSLRPQRGGLVEAEGFTDALSGDFITMGDGFAERIFDIAETTDRHGFVQQNLSQRLERQYEISALQNRLSRINDFEAAAAAAGNPSYTPSDLGNLQVLGEQLNQLWAQIGLIEQRFKDQKQWLPGHLYNLIGEDESSSIFRPLWARVTSCWSLCWQLWGRCAALCIRLCGDCLRRSGYGKRSLDDTAAFTLTPA